MKKPPLKVSIAIGVVTLLALLYAIARMDNVVATGAADKALEEETREATPQPGTSEDTP